MTKELKAYALTFREPIVGEFGYNHCQGQLLYLEFKTESMSLNWFLGENESNQAMIWKQSDRYSSFFQDIKICNDAPTPDGTYPIDSPSGVSPIQYSTLAGDNNRIASSYLFSDSFNNSTGSNTTPFVVVTSKLTEENIIKEFSDTLLIDSYTAFESMISFLAVERSSRNNFSAQKKVLQEVISSPIRSSQILCEKKANYYKKILATYPTPTATNFFNLSDEEIISAWYRSHNTVRFIDARYLINISTTPNKGVNSTKNSIINTSTKLYIGKIYTEDVADKHNLKSISTIHPSIQNLLLVSRPYDLDNKSEFAKANHLFHIAFNNDMSFFEVHAISKANSGSSRGHGSYRHNSKKESLRCKDILASGKLVSKIASKFGDSDVIGCASAIPIEKFNDVCEIIYTSDKIKSLDILPNEPLLDLGESISTLVDIDIKINKLLEVNPLVVSIPDFTHSELDYLEDNIICSHIGTPTTSCCMTSKGKKTDERLDIISEKLEVIYNLLQPLLKGYWQFILGNPAIDRGFLIVESTQSSTVYRRSNNAEDYIYFYTEGSKFSKTLAPSFSVILAFARYTKVYKNQGFWGSDAIDEAIAQFYSSIDIISDSDVGDFSKIVAKLDTITIEHYKNKNLIVPKDTIYNGINLSNLSEQSILEMLCATAFELMIENQSFINFSNTHQIIVRPRDIVRYILGQRSYKGFQLMRSVYA